MNKEQLERFREQAIQEYEKQSIYAKQAAKEAHQRMINTLVLQNEMIRIQNNIRRAYRIT